MFGQFIKRVQSARTFIAKALNMRLHSPVILVICLCFASVQSSEVRTIIPPIQQTKIDTTRNQYISDCDYYAGKYSGESELVFICSEHNRTNQLFERFAMPVCRNQFLCGDDCKDGFFQFMVGMIRFDDCTLREIPKEIFTVYERIHTFDVAGLDIQRLQANSFNGAKQLIKINGSHNKITSIPAHLFNQSGKIENVDFSFNQITYFDAETFATENQLKVLNLSGNNITELTVKSFQRLTKLKQLFLSNNQIVEIPSFLFHKTDKLSEIDLSYNKIRKMDDFAFAGDLNLKKINFSHNQLITFHRKILESLSELSHLDLSWNKLTALTADSFVNHRNLVHLDLSGNSIKQFNNKTFEHLERLQHLNLSRMSLSTIQAGAFSSLMDLQILDLSNNQLMTLDGDSLPFHHPLLPYQLKWISIANNQLHELANFTSERIPDTKIAGIDSNRFNCSFYDRIFQSIAWKQLESISERINCSSAHDESINSLTESLDSIDDPTPSITKNTSNSNIHSQSAKIANDSLEAIDENRKITQRNEQIANNQSDDLISLKKYFFVLVCVMIAGFMTISLVFVCIILRMGVCDVQTPQKPTQTHKRADLANSVNNHIYDVIEMSAEK